MSNVDGRPSGRGQPSGDDHLDDALLSRLVDDDLGADARRLADDHLAACPACAARLDALRSTVALLQGLPAPRPARSFQLAPSHARRASGWRRLSRRLTIEMPALRAAVVAIVLMIGAAAAVGVLRDDFRGDSTSDVVPEATVGLPGGDSDGPPTGALETPSLVQAPANTPFPTATPDPSVSRSAPDAAAAEPETSTPPPTQQVAEEPPRVSAPVPASTATFAAVPTQTPERTSVFGIDTEATTTADDAAGDEDTAPSQASADEAPADEASGDAVPTPQSTVDRSEAPAGGAESAGQDDADLEQSADAQDDANAAESAPASSASFDEAPPTATARSSPMPTPPPTMTPATPVASPAASPVTSPAASPVVARSGQAIAIDGNMSDIMTPHRINTLLGLAIVVFLGGIAAARATRGTPDERREPFPHQRR